MGCGQTVAAAGDGGEQQQWEQSAAVTAALQAATGKHSGGGESRVIRGNGRGKHSQMLSEEVAGRTQREVIRGTG